MVGLIHYSCPTELVQTTIRDLAGRPTSISYQSGTNALATYSMAYLSASNRLASLTTPQGTTNYGYSANGQLIQAGSTGYTYDANGNPTNRAGKTTQIGTWNRLLDDGDFTYQYDAEGRTTGRTSKTTGQTESYVWNRRGQLTQIDVHSNASLTNRTGQVNYSYDPTGRRTSVRNQTGIGSGSYAQSVDYLMSDGDQVGQILGATGQTTRRFRYGIGVDSVLSEQRFSGSTASNPEYQLTDHLGTVRGVAQRTSGVNAAVVNTLQYDSFGKIISQSNASKQPYHGFAGRDIEPVGGLTYNRNRYYSTQTGRFISQDPIGFNAGDKNLYRYVGNSPTNATDPSGLEEYRDDFIEELRKRGTQEAFEALDETMSLGKGNTRFWQAHHWFSQHDSMAPWLQKMAPGGMFSKGVHSPTHIVAVPTHAHNQITREQREFWDQIGSELDVDKGKLNYRRYEDVTSAIISADDATQKRIFSRYQEFVKAQQSNWSGFYIGVNSSADDIAKAHHTAINATPTHLGPQYGIAFNESRKRYINRANEQVENLLSTKPKAGTNWSKWLRRFGILVTVYGGLNTASAMSAPTPEQQDKFDAFLAAYSRVLRQKSGPMGSPSREALMNLGDAAANWGRSIGLDDKITNSIQCGLYWEGSNH